MSKTTKTFSIRLESDFIEEFSQAINSLPVLFKSQSVLKSYRHTIIDLSEPLNSSNDVKDFGIVQSKSGFAIVDLKNKVNKIQISEDIFNVKE